MKGNWESHVRRLENTVGRRLSVQPYEYGDSPTTQYNHLLVQADVTEDYCRLLAALPEIASELIDHREAVLRLAETVVAQQEQITVLSARLESLVQAELSSRIVDQLHNEVQAMVANGIDVGHAEVKLGITAELSTLCGEDLEFSIDEVTSDAEGGAIGGGITGLLSFLGLHFSREESFQRLRKQAKRSRKRGMKALNSARRTTVKLKLKGLVKR